MKARVEKDKCIACGLCVSTCSAVFEFDDDGLAKAKEGAIDNTLAADVQAAADGCPTSAIEVDPEG
ncbi:MAG: ferredoxin [Chloroflexota bacterium]